MSDNTAGEGPTATRKLVLAAVTDLGLYGLSTGPDAVAAVAALIVNAANLQRAVDKAALDALREAVKGCGGGGYWMGKSIKCGDWERNHASRGTHLLLCPPCARKRDAAISRLLGSEIEGDTT